MKKLVLSAILLAGTAFTSVAQVNSNAIGVRLYRASGFNGAELSYQRGFGDNNRLEIDLSAQFSANAYSVVGAYHWDYSIIEGLNWFAGPAVQFVTVGPLDFNAVGIGAQVGIEYDFNNLGAPILIGLDVRPTYFFNFGDNALQGKYAAFSARYTF